MKAKFAAPTHEITSSVIRVTPEAAAELLKGHKNYRTPSSIVVTGYARDMAAGKWQLNGEAIKFDSDGRLVDGQHRLLACIKSGVTLHTLAIYNATPLQDTGRKRVFADVLGARGYQNTKRLASALVIVAAFDRAKPGVVPPVQTKLTHSELDVSFAAHPDIERWCYLSSAVKGIIPPSAGIALAYLFGLRDASASGVFWERLTKGSDLAIDSPMLVLRNQLSAEGSHHGNFMLVAKMAYTIKAWNAWRAGRSCRNKFQWKRDADIPESFPVIQ